MKALDYILSYSHTQKNPKEIYPVRVYNLLKSLDYNPDKIQYVHVAGSKGKGSLAQSSFELLKAMGDKVGLFVSPHIFDVRERFVTSDGMISENQLILLIERFTPVLEKQKFHFFEVCLFLALIFFEEETCDYVVLEVGVGGRYDPTNFCTPFVSLLGHISMEHKEFLGDSLEKIAFDKAGIIKKNVPAFSVDQDRNVKEVFLREGNVHFYSDICSIENLTIFENYASNFSLKIQGQLIYNINLTRIGQAHIKNFCLAVAGIMSKFPLISYDIIREVAEKKIPYRMDLIHPDIIIDTAHNDTSFQNLMETLDSWMHWKDITLYLTILEEKDIQKIASILKKYKNIVRRIKVFDFDATSSSRKSCGLALLALLKDDFTLEYIPDLRTHQIKKAPLERLVFAGSFYSVSIIRDLLKDQNLCN